MRYSLKILTSLFVGLLALTNAAEAGLIVESTDQVLGKQIYEPGFAASRNTAPQAPSVIYSDQNTKNRFKYASDAVSEEKTEEPQNTKQPDIQIVDLNSYKTSLVLSEGQYLAVRLDETASEKWIFENRGRSLEFLKSEKRGNIIILLYQVRSTGSCRLNFDKLENGIAVASKVLQVRVI